MRRFLTFCTVVLILLHALASCTMEEPLPDIVGIWFGSSVDVPSSPPPVDATITIRTDGTYETLMYDVGGSDLQNMSNRGTYTASHTIFTATMSEMYDGTDWVAAVAVWSNAYSVSGDTMLLYQDFDQDGTVDAIWTLTRQ